MTKSNLVLSLVLLISIGCATTAPVSVPNTLSVPSLDDGIVTYSEWGNNMEESSESLARLAELEILSVGELLVDAPDASGNCYGPCQDEPVDQAWMAEHARQTARLAAFVEAAEAAVQSAPAPVSGQLNETLNALSALAIVEVYGIQNAGNCYVPCEGEEAAVAVAAALVDATQNL